MLRANRDGIARERNGTEQAHMTREYATAADGRDRKRKGEFRKREILIAQTVRHRMLHLVNTMYKLEQAESDF